MSHGIRTDDRQLAEDLKLCREATKDLMPDSVLYFRLDARRASGLIEELIDLRAELANVERLRASERALLCDEIAARQRAEGELDKFRPLEFLLKREGAIMDQVVEKIREQAAQLAGFESVQTIKDREAFDLRATLSRVEAERDSLDRLVAGVPDLVRSAFEEAFVGNGSGSLGPAWDRSKVKAALEGAANPIPTSWRSEREKIVSLESRLARVEAERDGLRAAQTFSDDEAHDLAWGKHYDPLTCSLDPIRVGRRCMLAAVRELLGRSATPTPCAPLDPPKREKDCGDCARLPICNGELACLCGPTGKMFDRTPTAAEGEKP